MKDNDKTKEPFSELAEMLPYNVEIERSQNKCRRAEEALPAAENLYRTIFENTKIATVILGEDNTILLVNGAYEQLTGYTREELEGKKKWTEFVARRDELERMKEYHRLRRIDPLSAPQTYEFQRVDREGQVKDIFVTVTTMPGRKESLVVLLDISDRKRAEAALQESERRLIDIIDFLPDPTYAIDLSGKVIVWNRAIEEMTGVKAEDMLGEGDHKYIIPFYGTRRKVLIDLVLGFDEELEKKYDFVKREGDVLLAEAEVPVRGVPHYLWGKSRPLYNSCGNVVGAIESVRDITALKQAQKALQKAHDELEVRVEERTAELAQANNVLQKEITERKRAEAVLKDNEKKFAEIFLKSPIPMAITAIKDGRYVEVNESFVKIMGLKREELIGNTSTGVSYITAEERELFLEEYRRKGSVENLELLMRVRDGQLRYGLVNTSKITVNCENFFLTMVTDITERKRIEEALRLHSDILANMDEGVQLTRAEDRVIVYSNPRFDKMFGYDPGELVGKHVSILNAPSDKSPETVANEIIRRLEQLGEWSGEVNNIKKDGTSFWCYTNVSIFQHQQHGKVWISVHQDITERRLVEEELKKYHEKLEIMVAERTKDLEDRTKNLQEVNTALSVLLQKREEDRMILEDSFVENVRRLVLPYLEKIRKNNLDTQQRFCLDIVEKHLGEIVIPMLKNIQQFNLTPREIQIASLIRDGKTTKEIARVLGIGKGSIDTHRKNIRKKLGLDRASNLQSRLRFLEK